MMLLKLFRSREVGVTVGLGLPEWENNNTLDTESL